MHRPSRPHRTWTALLAACVMLWSQLALAAYVCPGPGSLEAPATMAERMAAGEPCDGMPDASDARTPALCHQHCVDAPQSPDTAPVPSPGPVALAQAWPLPMGLLLLPEQDRPMARGATEAPPRPPPEPLFLSTLRVRV